MWLECPGNCFMADKIMLSMLLLASAMISIYISSNVQEASFKNNAQGEEGDLSLWLAPTSSPASSIKKLGSECGGEQDGDDE